MESGGMRKSRCGGNLLRVACSKNRFSTRHTSGSGESRQARGAIFPVASLEASPFNGSLLLVFLVDIVGEDELQVIESEVRGEAFVSEHVGDELRLLVLEDADFLFHGVSC